jgi:hypothetical protein
MMRSLAFGLVMTIGVVACSDDADDGPGSTGGAGTTSSSTSASSSSASSTAGGAGGAGGSGGGGAGGAGGVGGGGGCVATDGIVLAVSQLFLGDTDFNGVTSATAWRQLGFDIDGKVSTASSTDLCQPNAGGNPSSVHPDGDAGIDNAWGKNVLPLFLALTPDYSTQVNDLIDAGEFTMMLAFIGLAAEADKPAFTTRLYNGAPLGHPAAFDGSECWPVVRELLDDPADIESSKTVFPASTLQGNAWSSGGVGTVTLELGGFPMRLRIHQARMTTMLDPNHQGATLGQLGGVIDTEEFIVEVKKAAGAFDPSLCEGGTIESIADQFRQASDILKDGTQDPLQTCDGISIGIGFEMESAQLGGVAQPAPPVDDPCMP